MRATEATKPAKSATPIAAAIVAFLRRWSCQAESSRMDPQRLGMSRLTRPPSSLQNVGCAANRPPILGLHGLVRVQPSGPTPDSVPSGFRANWKNTGLLVCPIAGQRRVAVPLPVHVLPETVPKSFSTASTPPHVVA